jgi:hypothetical protein
VLSVLRRRGWLLIAATVAVAGCAYLIASARGITHSAEGVAVVAANTRLTPDQANRLAVTYAVLIPKDEATAERVAGALGTTTTQVQRRLTVFNPPNTAVLQIDYDGTSARNARAGVAAVLLAISGASPASPNIAPRSVGVVRYPQRASSSSGVKTLVPIGLILGLALGALLLAAWERADPRIDDVDDLAGEAGCPASTLEAISDSGATALIARWAALGPRASARVALVPVTRGVERRLQEVARRLARGQPTGAGAEHRTRQPWAGDVSLILGSVPEGGFAGEMLAMNCDLTVLVVNKGTRRIVLRTALDVLSKFGIAPAWAIFITRREGSVPEEIQDTVRLRRHHEEQVESG